jgi:formylmethanofuran dehydrogenase subunit C
VKKITLRPKDKEYMFLDADNVTPDDFAGKTLDEVRAVEIYEGNRTYALGDYFDVIGETDPDPNEIGIVIDGSVPKVKYIGMKMSAGKLLVKGSVGMYAGGWMTGGRLRVNGDAGAYAGIAMEGGELVIDGNAGDYIGANYRGDWRGMKGGKIVVSGNAGSDIGEAMVGGEIVVKGNADLQAGIHAHGGKIVIEGDAESRVGAQMTKGEIIVLGKIGYWLPGFIYKKDDQIDYDGNQYAVKVYQGDRGEGGKGTLYYAGA